MILPDATYTRETAAANGLGVSAQDRAMDLGVLHPIQVGSHYVFKGSEIIAAQFALGRPVNRLPKSERTRLMTKRSAFKKKTAIGVDVLG